MGVVESTVTAKVTGADGLVRIVLGDDGSFIELPAESARAFGTQIIQAALKADPSVAATHFFGILA